MVKIWRKAVSKGQENLGKRIFKNMFVIFPELLGMFEKFDPSNEKRLERQIEIHGLTVVK